jgi:hypothetical protein
MNGYRLGLLHGALLVGFVLAIFVIAHAQVSLSVFGLSKHSESGYCEVNPGLGLSYEVVKDLRVGGAKFLNSKCRWSNMAGVFYTPFHWRDLSFGIAPMWLTGYRDKPVFAPLPVGSYRLSRHGNADFFAVKNSDLYVTGAAWRYEW